VAEMASNGRVLEANAAGRDSSSGAAATASKDNNPGVKTKKKRTQKADELGSNGILVVVSRSTEQPTDGKAEASLLERPAKKAKKQKQVVDAKPGSGGANAGQGGKVVKSKAREHTKKARLGNG